MNNPKTPKKLNIAKYGMYIIRSEKGRKVLENLFETAVETSEAELAQTCIKKGVDPNIFLQRRDTALHLSDRLLFSPRIEAEKGDTNLGQLLLTCKDIKVNPQNEKGNTPLHLATIFDKRNFVLLLLANGADPNIQNYSGKIPLHFASEHNNFLIVHDLLKNHSEINVADVFGNTPLSLSVIENPNINIAKTLLKNGANPNLATLRPHPLLLEAVLNCNSEKRLEMIDLLITNGVDVNIIHPISKMTPLHMVAITGYYPAAKDLLQHGGSLEIKDAAGRSPIGIAMDHGRTELVELYHEVKGIRFQSILKKLSLNDSHSDTHLNKSRKAVSFGQNNSKSDQSIEDS